MPGLHRYEVAQGFQPERVGLAGSSEPAVIAEASDRMGGPPSRVWRSSESSGLAGAAGVPVCAWAG